MSFTVLLPYMNRPANIRLAVYGSQPVSATHRLEWGRSHLDAARWPQYLEVGAPRRPRLLFYLYSLGVAIVVATLLVPRLYGPVFAAVAANSPHQPATTTEDSSHESSDVAVEMLPLEVHEQPGQLSSHESLEAAPEANAEPFVDLGSRVSLAAGQVAILIALLTFAGGLAIAYSQRVTTYRIARSQFHQAIIEKREREIRHYETIAQSYFTNLVTTCDISMVCEHARYLKPPPAELRETSKKGSNRSQEPRFVCTILTLSRDNHVHIELAWVDAMCADSAFNRLRLQYGWDRHDNRGSVATEHAAYYSNVFLVFIEVVNVDWVELDRWQNYIY